MNPFDHTEEDAIKTLLEETAGQIKPSSAFTANLEKQLKQTHKPKAGLNMLILKKVAAPVGWGLALIALAFAFNWIASQIAPKTVPGSNGSTPQPAPFSEESTPVSTISTPAGQVYEWNGQSVYLNAALPEASPEMKIYLAQDEVSASIQDVQTLAEKFGMQGEIYEVQGEIPDTTDYLMVDGNQQLRVRSDRYFTYYPNYAESMYAFDTKENPNAEALIAEFMQAYGFDMNYKLERSAYFGGYFAIPLTPDGFIIRHEHFTVNGFIFEFNENGIVRARSSLLKYDEVETVEIISAEEALNKLLVDTGLSYGVLSGMHSAAKETSSWIRTRPLDQTFTYYAILQSTGKSITGGAPLVTLDGYTVTGNVQDISENMPNTFVEAHGQFHESNGIRTFELESWSDYTGYEEGYVGTILQEGNQTFFLSAEGNKLKIEDLPADLPLPAENIFTTGVTHDGEFDWKSIDDRATSGGGGGGGGSSGFYQLNLSGTPMPLPTTMPLQTPTLDDTHRFERQRGIPRIMIFTQADGSQHTEYRFSSNDPEYPYVLLEGENLEVLQDYNNRPVEIWGVVDHFAEDGNIVVKVERFEIPFPDLEFQILKGTEKSVEVEGNIALLFTAENGQSYVQLYPDCYNIVGPEMMAGSGEDGEQLLVEALIVPDLTIGGYPTVCVHGTQMADGPSDDPLSDLSVRADQLEVIDDSLFPLPTMSIEKVELAYFTPDRRYYPESEPGSEPPYLQPVWIFSGHYSDGSEFEFIVQALKDEYLSPEVQAVRQPG
jgi:hypothetical protein